MKVNLDIPLPSYKELALVASATLLSFIALEGTARIWLNHFATPEQSMEYVLYTDLDDQQIRWSPHHYLNYYLTPGYSRGLTYHNTLGYRDREFRVKKQAGRYRIVALGGSSTYTSEVEDNRKTFTAQLERILVNEYHYRRIEVINAGVPDYTSWESLINLEFRVLDLEPDLVIIYHGTNDVHARFVVPTAYKGDNSGKRKRWQPIPVPLLDHSTVLRIIRRNLGLSRQAHVGLFVDAPSYIGPGAPSATNATSYDEYVMLKKNRPIYFRRNLTSMVAIAKADGREIILSTWAHSPYFDDYASTGYYQLGFKENNQVVREVAEGNDVPLFDFVKVMLKDKRYWADGRHVNEAGALLKAKLFADFIHKSRIISANQMNSTMREPAPTK